MNHFINNSNATLLKICIASWLMILWPIAALSSDDDTWVETNYCTTVEDLNPSTAYFYGQRNEMVFSANTYPKLKHYFDINDESDLDKLEILTNEKDSAICSRIREKLRTDMDKHYVWDLEKKRYFPSRFIIMYQVPSKGYIAFTGMYNISYNEQGQRPYIMGGGHFFVFDENLNRIVDIEN